MSSKRDWDGTPSPPDLDDLPIEEIRTDLERTAARYAREGSYDIAQNLLAASRFLSFWEERSGLALADPRYLHHLRLIEKRAIEEGWTTATEWEKSQTPFASQPQDGREALVERLREWADVHRSPREGDTNLTADLLDEAARALSTRAEGSEPERRYRDALEQIEALDPRDADEALGIAHRALSFNH